MSTRASPREGGRDGVPAALSLYTDRTLWYSTPRHRTNHVTIGNNMTFGAMAGSTDDRDRQRVAITGIGAVTGLGAGAETLWRGLIDGRSGARRIFGFDPSDLPCHIAAEVPELPAVPGRIAGYAVTARPYVLAVAASIEALEQAAADDVPPERRAVAFSGGAADLLLDVIAGAAHRLGGDGPDVRHLLPDDLPGAYPDDDEVGQLDHHCGAQLPLLLGGLAEAREVTYLSTACAGGAQAIGNAARMIRMGEADLVLAGGVDCLVTRQIVSGFGKLSALSTRNDDPQGASRPFDETRDGFVLGEGAGVMVMESWCSARGRGAPILAELVGVGLSGDAYRLTDPEPQGSGMIMSMQRALDDASLAPQQVDYVNAHGTSTAMNDAAETRALKQVLGDHAYRVPISSSKSMIGHSIHAAGAVEAVVCVRSLGADLVHPTLNLRHPDPDCDLDYVPGEARQVPLQVAMSNAFGFGGQNTTLVLRSAD